MTGRRTDRRGQGAAARRPGGRGLGSALAMVMLAVGVCGAATASAQTRLGVRAGMWVDGSDPVVGVDLLMPVEPRWWVDPSLEFVAGDGVDRLLLNGDVLYDLGLSTRATVWVGGGIALLFSDFDLPHGRSESETDIGLNLIAGTGTSTAAGLEPYLQGKLVLSDDSSAAVVLGLRF